MTHKKASSSAQIIYFTSVKQNIPHVIVDLNGWSSLLLLNAIDWLQPHRSLQRTGDEPLGNSDNDCKCKCHLNGQSMLSWQAGNTFPVKEYCTCAPLHRFLLWYHLAMFTGSGARCSNYHSRSLAWNGAAHCSCGRYVEWACFCRARTHYWDKQIHFRNCRCSFLAFYTALIMEKWSLSGTMTGVYLTSFPPSGATIVRCDYSE